MPQRYVRNGEVWKRCPGCDRELPHNADHYYRDGTHPDGTAKFYTRCKQCCIQQRKGRRTDQSPNAQERHRRRLRARQRAWVKLGRRHPHEFRDLYEEELAREYLTHGPMPPRNRR